MIDFEFSVDRELRIVGCSRALEDARLGSGADLRGRPYFECLPRIFWEGSDAVAAVANRGRPLSLSNYRFSCLFETFEAEIAIVPLLDESGDLKGVRVTVKAPEGCRPGKQLQRSQPLIDIGKNAAILSHGVRNPLNAIKGAVVYLKNRYSAEDTLVEFTRIMEEEISRLDRFITAFLSGSADEPEKSIADLNELLKKVESLVALQAGTSGIDIIFSLGEIPQVAINAFQIEQAVLNVLNNALSALSCGGKIVVKSLTEERKGRSFAVVEISDNGPGIPGRGEESYSAPLGETSRSRGKGFGLFITREVLQHHDGMLEIASRKNQGTKVRLVLPATERGSSG